MKSDSQVKALRASKVGVFTALYVVTSLIPISVFIGAPSFLALNLIMTPALALLLSPLEAFLASLFGGIITLYVATFQAMFGPFTILLPITGSTFGSLAYHKRRIGASLAALFLVTTISAYLVKNYPFPYFVTPHLLATLVAIASSLKKMTPLRMKIPMYAFISTMCEQGMMMVLAVYLLGLPWQVFPGILPLMIYERAVGTIGSVLVVSALAKATPSNIKVATIHTKPC